MLTIDGSFGEGGGQILRTSLALSMLTGTAFRLTGIRAGRTKPGLLRQHLTGVEAASAICAARTRGAELNSQDLTFEPNKVRAGDYRFSIGTAGSTTLVLQAVLPALLTASGSSTLEIEGGTHNPFAPPFDFLSEAFLPLIGRMGPTVTTTLKRHGFFPAGGGRLIARIDPVAQLQPLELPERGEVLERTCRIYLAALPRAIADREWAVVRERLNWPDDACEVVTIPPGCGPGNVLSLLIRSENVTEVFTSFGVKGVSSEQVARAATDEAREYLAAQVPVGPHLADQLLLPLAIAGRGSFVTSKPTSHTLTNIDIIARFLDVPIRTEKLDSKRWQVMVGLSESRGRIQAPKSVPAQFT